MAGKDPPDRNASYASKARGKVSCNVKAYADIVKKHKKERNMLEISFVKEKKQGEAGRANRNVEMEVVSEYLFGTLKINPAEILEVDLNTGKPEVKQILFKPGVDTDKYTSNFPDSFGDFSVSVNKISSTMKRVTFRNVPSYVPDEEILNLCSLYGEVEGEVKREKMTMKTPNGSVNVATSVRFVMMKMKPGVYFNNYYWLEGPLQGDQGKRVTVLHTGQPQQCSFCLASIETGCHGMGNGKQCEAMGGSRKRMSEYMKEFKESTGYMSLKDEYLLAVKKLQNEFQSNLTASTPEDMDQYVLEAEEGDEEEDDSVGIPVFTYVSPLTARENKIKELTKDIEEFEKEIPNLKNENEALARKAQQFRNLLEGEIKKIVEVGGVNDDMANFVANSYASTIKESDIFKDQSGAVSINKKDFLKDIIEHDLNPVQKERFDYIAAKILKHLPCYIGKVPRRLSLSMKRPKENTNEEDNKEEKKARGDEEAAATPNQA